jgi:hypothetical protein
MGDASGAGFEASYAGDHAHPRVVVAPAGRTEAWAAAAVVLVVATHFDPPIATALCRVLPDEFPGPDTPTGPPPKLRSPPVR